MLRVFDVNPLPLAGSSRRVYTGYRDPSPGLSTSTPAEQTVTLVEHRDSERGFSFSLPASWEGLSIAAGNWDGLQRAASGDEVVEQGSIVSIIHPKSTTEQPRQDIPIMVFTIEQWDRLQKGEWHVGAAPIGPIELSGRFITSR